MDENLRDATVERLSYAIQHNLLDFFHRFPGWPGSLCVTAFSWHRSSRDLLRRHGAGGAQKGLRRSAYAGPLLEAREMGFRYGILQSSKMGFPVYRRLGFEQYFTMENFYWRK